MGFLCKGNDPKPVTSVSTVSSGLPDWVNKGGEDLWNVGKQVSQQPFPKFGGFNQDVPADIQMSWERELVIGAEPYRRSDGTIRLGGTSRIVVAA